MSIPVQKNRRWIASLHESLDRLDKDEQAAIMKPVGEQCASDILSLCEDRLGRKAATIEDLIDGWNKLRDARGLKGRWELAGNRVTGTFLECGCPLVRSGMIDLHPVQCYCSQGMLETIFSMVAGGAVSVDIRRSIGWGNDVCELVVNLLAACGP